MPFPPVSWWKAALTHHPVVFDLNEPYQKMSYRNRYYLAAPQGKQMLSVPLMHGRNQRIPMSDVRLANEYNWQQNHWRTIVSLYGRSPYFEHFQHLIQPLFETPYERLAEWNLAGFELLNKILRLGLKYSCIGDKDTSSEPTIDCRGLKPSQSLSAVAEYYQVFSSRTAFLADCSMLDLLFCEGLYAASIIKT
jgi:hypothetical protein